MRVIIIGSNTIRNLLVSPRDKDPMVNKNEAIYCFQCGDLSCTDEYIGETSRTFGERYNEDLKDLDAPCMFGCPPYVWIPLYVWTPSYFDIPPVCLDASHMFGDPHMFGHPI